MLIFEIIWVKKDFFSIQIIRNKFVLSRIDSRIFPRITGCDVITHELGTLHHYTLQCVLSLNLFYERIYVFLWFWVFIILVPFLTYDLIAWTLRLFIFSNQYMYKFIKRRVKIFSDIHTHRDKFLLKIFTEYYISADGVFLLRLIERNSNAGIVSELLEKMWNDFKKKEFLAC